MNLTIGELIAQLEEIAQEHGSDLPVRMATQPNYPLAFNIAGVHVAEGVAWVAEGERGYSETPYAPKGAWGSDA